MCCKELAKTERLFFSYSLPSLKCNIVRIRQCVAFSDQFFHFSSVQLSRSVAQSCPTLCDPMNLSTPGLLVQHQLPEFTQTHIHRVGDAIQPSHPLSSPSPPAPNSSQHKSFSNESTLCMRWPKYWSFSFSIIPSKEILMLISFRMDWLDLRVFSNTIVQKHQFFSAQPSSQSNSHIHT